MAENKDKVSKTDRRAENEKRRARRKAEDDARRAAMPEHREKLPAWKTLALVLVALALAVGCFFGGRFIYNYATGKGSMVYSTPEQAASAYFEALSERNFEKELSCFPPEVKDYFIEEAGGEEAYAESFEVLCDQFTGVSVTIGEASPADETSMENLEIFKQRVSADFTADKVVHVAFTYTATESAAAIVGTESTESTDDSGFYVTCVSIDGRWYVFVD